MDTKVNSQFETLNSKKGFTLIRPQSGGRGGNQYGFTLIRRKASPLSQQKAFTLIELLVSMAIIGLLVALMVPAINRSLSNNNIANDADLLKAKLEETRLLAASTQQADTQKGYYALYLPKGNPVSYFAILRLTASSTDDTFVAPCTAEIAMGQAIADDPNNFSCVVDRVNLSSNVVLLNGGADRLIIYRSPNQELFEGRIAADTHWHALSPVFNWGANVKLKLQSPAKVATISVDAQTGKLTIAYQ